MSAVVSGRAVFGADGSARVMADKYMPLDDFVAMPTKTFERVAIVPLAFPPAIVERAAVAMHDLCRALDNALPLWKDLPETSQHEMRTAAERLLRLALTGSAK